MADRFLDRIHRGPLLLDAAMGTRLIQQGLKLKTDDPCLWNLTHPEGVLAIHLMDRLTAWPDAVFTNTFGANRRWLDRLGRGSDVAAVNQSGVELARGTGRHFVIGSIGPTASDEPKALREQAEILVGAGVDALALETYQFDQARVALKTLRGTNCPILVGLFDWPNDIGAAVAALLGAGADLVGLNCSADRDLIHRFLAATEAAGVPCWLKPATTEPGGAKLRRADFAEIAGRIRERGVDLIGGCCGTDATHLQAIRAAWNDEASGQRR